MSDGDLSDTRGRRRRVRRISLAVLIVLLVAAATAVLRERGSAHSLKLSDAVHPGAASGFNVLLITLDTTRWDRLGCYGYAAAETPAIDSLAAHGVRFDDAVTSAPLTLPSHATMFTGLYPLHHGVRHNGTYRLGADQVTLTETLKANGYDTAAFVACFILDRRFGPDAWRPRASMRRPEFWPRRWWPNAIHSRRPTRFSRAST
ncbi:MAG: sulfatase-like hydrolase/transferase [Planctomycetota bacterium]